MALPLLRFVIDRNITAVKAIENTLNALSPEGLSVFSQTQVTQFLQHRAEERFRTEGDDASGPWAELAPATAGYRENQGYPAGPINYRSGELEHFITTANGDVFADGAGVGIRFPDESGMDSHLWKKYVGAQAGDRKAPPRPVVAVNINDLGAILYMLSNFINGAGARHLI